jgi:predicted GNAT superfamily acetyltransferase
MQYVIRDVSEDDIDAALALNQAVVPHVNSINVEKMTWFAEHADYFRVAEGDDRVAAMLVGFLPGSAYDSQYYRWFCTNYPLFAYIDRVAVDLGLRRAGLARALYDDFEETLGQFVPMLACEVNILPANAGSMAFHEQMGFEQIEHGVIDPGVREVARLMKATEG